MKTIVLFKLTSLLLLTSSPLFGQAGGPLSPPAAPGKVYKTLDQVEPRTPVIDGEAGVSIDASTGSITLSQSGSYYLLGNVAITSATGTAINITSSNVTLDINGFTVSSAVLSSNNYGIKVDGGTVYQNITIKNGNLHQFGYAITFESVSNSRLTNLNISNADEYAIEIAQGHSNLIKDCNIYQSRYQAIVLEDSSTNSFTNLNISEIEGYGIRIKNNISDGGTSNTFKNCTITQKNSAWLPPLYFEGIDIRNHHFERLTIQSNDTYAAIESNANRFIGNTFTQCSLATNAYTGSLHGVLLGQESMGNTFEQCSFTSFTNAFYADGSFLNNRIDQCSFTSSDYVADCAIEGSNYPVANNSITNCRFLGYNKGIKLGGFANKIEDCSFYQCDEAITLNSSGSSVKNCTISECGTGINLYGGSGNTMAGNTMAEIWQAGIRLDNSDHSLIRNNNIHGGTGIEAFARNSRIEANHFDSNGGASVHSTGENFIFKNTSSNASYSLDANDIFGPVINGPSGGPLPNTGDPSHPNANFQQ